MGTQIVPDASWMEPATDESKESLDRIQNIIGDFDPDHTMKYYDYWSKFYENDLKNMDYNVPNEMVASLIRSVPKQTVLDESFSILDIGSGTGQMAVAFRKLGEFKGTMDALDGNSKMLSKAVKKNLYRHHTIHFLLETNPLPHPSNSYDAVVCCCAMVPGLIQPECLPEMVRLVKAGGTFCFTTRATDGNSEFADRVTRQIKKLEDDGMIEVYDKRTVPQYSWPVNAEVTEESKKIVKHCISAILYGIKKLKKS